MNKKVFSVYDIRAELYSTPFQTIATGEAVRAFKDLCNDRSTQVGRHPKDFKLVQLGEFNTLTGRHTDLETPVSLGMGDEYVSLGDNAIPLSPVRSA